MIDHSTKPKNIAKDSPSRENKVEFNDFYDEMEINRRTAKIIICKF